ncbi:hypothetical protein AX774_g2990 [Zancudomyces culisetae]|uniref:Uncharacterized protein n=1 Tax=Zancudomyces culisetae TaxID=1213189 RepID=A0A1R1PPQ0_ZANCU|nr:hypothetical protein AX774_g3575 [Zancudomyces culisetae]OMH83518.1 hypothetical protein AX774_g2990 [Zancudomyces culisetae]|eukprot:OMH82929.1 hypothetical protein AX774_g3575 [Zancudomyces culisetae]
MNCRDGSNSDSEDIIVKVNNDIVVHCSGTRLCLLTGDLVVRRVSNDGSTTFGCKTKQGANGSDTVCGVSVSTGNSLSGFLGGKPSNAQPLFGTSGFMSLITMLFIASFVL